MKPLPPHALTNDCIHLYLAPALCCFVQLYDRLKSLHPNVTVYLKKDIPERFLLKRHQRTPPLLLVADKGYVIQYKV